MSKKFLSQIFSFALALLLCVSFSLSLISCKNGGTPPFQFQTGADGTQAPSDGSESDASKPSDSEAAPVDSGTQATPGSETTPAVTEPAATAPAVTEPEVPDTTASATASVDEKIDAYLKSIDSSFDAVRESLGDTMSFDIFGRDGSLVYSYRYKIDLPTSNAEVKATLDADIKKNVSSLRAALTAIRAEVPETTSVIVEYLDKNGTLITAIIINDGGETIIGPQAGGTTGAEGSVDDRINAYLQSISSSFDEIRESLGDMMDFDIFGQNGSLVYSYRYKIDLPSSNAEMKVALDQAMVESADSFHASLTAIRGVVPETKSVIVEYLDKNGTRITAVEFDENGEAPL